MKALRLVALTVALGCLTSRPALAQISFEGHIFGGGVFSVTDLVDGQFTAAGFTVPFESARMDDGFTFGGSLGVRYGQFGVEGEVMYWPSTQVTIAAGTGGAEVSLRASSNVLIAGGNILYHFTLTDIAIEPYVTGGAGIKRYNTDQPFGQGVFFVEATDIMWNVGLGANFPISASTALRVDVRDYMSSFDFEVQGLGSELQHDVVGKVGVSFSFGG